MKLIISLALVFILATKLHAQESQIPFSKVLSAVSDYQDTVYYRAVLVQGEEDADLYIYTRPDYENLQLEVYTPSIAVTGIGLTDAYLVRNDAGNLQLVSHNPAIGSFRWEQTLTIAYRNDQFIISGFTFSYYNTVETTEDGEVKTGHCDINLLTGKGIKDENPINTQMRAVPVKAWTLDTRVDECFD